jgi:nitrogen regulatory protein PII
MKAILIICTPALEGTIMDSLKKSGASNYTKLPYLLGEGGHSEPHLDNHVWPGANVGILVVTDEDKIKKISAEVKQIKADHIKEGVKAFVLPVEEII